MLIFTVVGAGEGIDGVGFKYADVHKVIPNTVGTTITLKDGGGVVRVKESFADVIAAMEVVELAFLGALAGKGDKIPPELVAELVEMCKRALLVQVKDMVGQSITEQLGAVVQGAALDEMTAPEARTKKKNKAGK